MSSKESKTYNPFLFRWEIIIVLLSLIISVASFWYSIYSAKRTESISASPNVQIISSKGTRSHTFDTSRQSSLVIMSEIILENAGTAPTQLINVKWEPMETGNPEPIEDPWLALSDDNNISEPKLKSYFYQNKINPILGIKDKNIEARSKKTIQMGFFVRNVLKDTHNIPNIRLTLIFNNGEERTVIPEIKFRGVGSAW